ncbi:MAG: hypothetical protein AAF317_01070 [Pseudomonadota bacterium]
MRKFPAIPRSPKEARARTARKLKALRRRNFDVLHEIAGYWDDGPIGSEIDTLVRDLDAAIDAVEGAVDEELARMDEEGNLL